MIVLHFNKNIYLEKNAFFLFILLREAFQSKSGETWELVQVSVGKGSKLGAGEPSKIKKVLRTQKTKDFMGDSF